MSSDHRRVTVPSNHVVRVGEGSDPSSLANVIPTCPVRLLMIEIGERVAGLRDLFALTLRMPLVLLIPTFRPGPAVRRLVERDGLGAWQFAAVRWE